MLSSPANALASVETLSKDASGAPFGVYRMPKISVSGFSHSCLVLGELRHQMALGAMVEARKQAAVLLTMLVEISGEIREE